MNDVGHIDILELIPQRPPFVMISRLIHADGSTATSCLDIREDNIFVDNGKFQESGLIEHIAQTAAAMNGYQAMVSGKPVRIGYLGGIKNLRIYALPGVGQRLTTTVTEESNVMNASIIRGRILEGSRLIAECEMKIFIQEV
jgi:predicted hotdog family 3-hydroxylacyl-ACP dehydratase